MAYDPNVDYMAIMKANKVGSDAYKAAEAARNEKIDTLKLPYAKTSGGVAVTSVNNLSSNSGYNNIVTPATDASTTTPKVTTLPYTGGAVATPIPNATGTPTAVPLTNTAPTTSTPTVTNVSNKTTSNKSTATASPNVDYQAQINALKAQGVPDNDPQIVGLNVLRANKIYSSPELTAAYENTIPPEYRRIQQGTGTSLDATNGDGFNQNSYTDGTGAQDATAEDVQFTTDPAITEFMNNVTTENAALKDQLATVKGQVGSYQSQYTPQINQALNNMQQEFTYDPNTDSALKLAQQQIAQATREEAAKRGALYGDTAQSMVAQEMAKQIPTYEELARQKFNDRFNRNVQIASTVMQLDSEAYKRSTDKITQTMDIINLTSQLNDSDAKMFFDTRSAMLQDKQFQLEAQKFDFDKEIKLLNNAMDRVNTIGYVDNETSAILGLPVGTPSSQAREAALNRENQIKTQQMQIDANAKENDKQIQANKDLETIRFGNEMTKLKSEQTYQSSEAAKDRTFKASESAKDRSFTASESAKDRSFRASEGAKDRAASSSGSGSVSSEDANDTYNGYLNIFASNPAINSNTGRTNIEDAAREILFGTDAQKILGKYFDNIASKAQQAYANQVRNDWNDMDSLGKELNRTSNLNPDTPMPANQYYKRMLGQYYNDLAY